MTLACGIIADDFTGAMLVAGYCETAGVACPVYFSPQALQDDPPKTPLAVLASRSRLQPPEQALSEIGTGIDALRAIGSEAIAYKACGTFDSTEEGNIGLAAELLADRMEQVPMLFSAGFPDYAITVHQGHMFLGAEPINVSAKRHDPVTPMPDPNLVRFLSQQTRTPLGLISHLEMSRGTAAAQAALAERVEQGFRHILLDLSDDADLAMSRSLASGARAVVASDPLIVAFALDRAAGHVSEPAPPRHADGPAALFVGSVGPVARGQLTSFEAEHPVLYLDLLDPRPEETLIEEAVAWALPRIGTRPFGITTWANARQIARIQSALGRLGAARKAERLLAGIAARCHGAGVRRFLVGGGETAGAIVGALGLPKVRALPLGPLRGGLCVAEGPDPVSLYLKSGKLGAPDVFLQALELMSNQEVS